MSDIRKLTDAGLEFKTNAETELARMGDMAQAATLALLVAACAVVFTCVIVAVKVVSK
jgi:hypothetical protein